MFANFTEETCTGTGDTLTLLGATTGNIAFSQSFSDGDVVSCSVIDADGINKASGIYTYNASPNTFTRADSWSWDGTSAVDKPLTNILLSNGTHTIVCVPLSQGLSTTPDLAKKWIMNSSGYSTPDNWDGSGGTPRVMLADNCMYLGIKIDRFVKISSLVISVITADIAATVSVAGIYSVGNDSKPGKLLASASIDVSTTGIKEVSLATPIMLPAGQYYTAFASNASPSILSVKIGSIFETSYANTLTIPRLLHPSEVLLSGWSTLPSMPNPTIFNNNYTVMVAWR